jgi:hypothetical protein
MCRASGSLALFTMAQIELLKVIVQLEADRAA